MFAMNDLNYVNTSDDLSAVLTFENSDDFSALNPIQNLYLNELPDGTFCLSEIPNNEVLKILNLEGHIEEQDKQDGSNKINVTSSPPNSSVEINQNIASNIQQPDPEPRKILPKEEGSQYSCVNCRSQFKTLQSYQDHLSWHKCEKKFKCTKCNQGYNVEINLKVHMALVHPDNNNTECPICHKNLTFQRQAGLKSHLMVHQVDEFYTCDQCNNEYDNENDYAKHIKSHFEDKKSSAKTNSSSLSCSYCKLNFQDAKSLRSHISAHTKIKKLFIKTKRSKTELRMQKKFSCKVCKKRFPKRSLLERHERVHSGEKPFKCDICEKCFSQKATMEMHKLSHVGVKPYACTLCPAKFTQKGNLHSHVRKTHSAEGKPKAFPCPHCSCVFKRISSLNGHVTKFHINEKPSPLGEISNVIKKLKELEKHISGPFVKEPNKSDESSSDPSEKVHDISNADNPKALITQYVSDGTLRKFLVNVKKVDDVRWFLCCYCSYRFKKPSDLLKHVKVHSKRRTGKSKKEFPVQINLTQNLNKNYVYKCKYCDGVFQHEDALNYHNCSYEKQDVPTQVSEDTKLFTCPLCLIEFNVLDKFQLHMQKHKELSQAKKEKADSNTNKETVLDIKSHVFKDILVQQPLEPAVNANNSIVYIDLNDAPCLELLENVNLNTFSHDESSSNLFLNDIQNVELPLQQLEQSSNSFRNQDIFSDNLVANIDNLQENINTAENLFNTTIICTKCGMLFTELNLFQRHTCGVDSCTEKDADTNVSEKATVPEKDTGSVDITTIPESKKSTGKSNQIVCHICKQTLSSKSYYNCHILTHLTGPSYECILCYKVLIGRTAYLKHLNQSHADASGVLHMICIYCRKRFKKPSDLARHIRVHTGEKPYVCKVCNRAFSLKSTMETHERVHNPNEKKFNCHTCNSSFSTKASLNVHQSIHTGQKPYECTICNMKFRTAGNRNSHIKLMHILKKKDGVNKKNKIKNVLESAVAEVVNNVNELQVSSNANNVGITVSQSTEEQIEETPSTSENVLPSLSEDQTAIDTLSLLNLLSSGVILTTNQGEEPLMLDDVALFNSDTGDNNYQIVSLLDTTPNPQTEINDGVQTPMTNSKKEKNKECQICHKMYSSQDALRRHMKTVHAENKKFPCTICSVVCFSNAQLVKHKEEHNSKAVVGQEETFADNCDGNNFIEIPKDVSMLGMKFDLPSHIDDSLFNLFPLKKL